MSKISSPRKGSLQYWPRKRAAKFLPRVNWSTIPSSKKIIGGAICYKAGMASAYVKDNTPDSMTKGKKIAVPVTILECPPIKIFSARFYKCGKVAKEIILENPDKELKRKLKFPKKKHEKIEEINAGEFNDMRIIVYSSLKKTKIKKSPDLCEIG